VSRKLADVFREFRDSYLANIPTGSDYLRFLKASRGILADDPELKQLSGRLRSEIVRGSLKSVATQDKMLDALCNAVQRYRSPTSIRIIRSSDVRAAKIARLRFEMAGIIMNGLGGDIVDRVAFDRAMLLLHEKSRDIATLSQQEHGARRTEKPASQDALKKWVRDAASAWRKTPASATKAEGYRRLFKLATKEKKGKWRNWQALRDWTYKHDIEI
jgi:hypothetical protein